MITRRQFLTTAAAAVGGTLALGGYAFGVEPGLRLRVQHDVVALPGWPAGLRLRLALVADIHACEPWMGIGRIERIVETANALMPDAILLLGDYEASHRFMTGRVMPETWATALAALRAPLGVHAIIGNHDWWQDAAAQRTGQGPVFARQALEAAGIPVYENEVVRLEKDGDGFWLAGLGDQYALRPWPGNGRSGFVGVDDLAGTLAGIGDDRPVILLAHEPDIFPEVPERVSLTLCGHTHGGQVRLFGYSPIVPSRFGNRFAYGHITEERNPGAGVRHLLVSGGLGCSVTPVRFGVPPEVNLVEVVSASG